MSRRGENIRKRKDGRWEGRYLQEVNGKKNYRSVYAKTYSEVKQKLLTEKNSIRESSGVSDHSPESMSLHELSVLWFAEVESLRKYSTYRKYMDIYENYIHQQLGNLSVREIGSDAVAKILPRQLSASTHRSIYCVLNQMLRYGNIYLGFPGIKLNPCITAGSAEPIEILNPGDQQRLLAQLCSDMDTYKLGIIICLSTGLRLGEICALKWEDIDFSNKLLHVNRTVQRVRRASENKKTMLAEGAPKTACSRREIPIPDYLLEIMARFWKENSYVLNGEAPTEPRTYQYKFHAYLQAAEISQKNFHILRHTFATNCISNGADKVLAQGGVVCGCCYDKKLQPIHKCITSAEELTAMSGSKYVQSDIHIVFDEIKSYLEQGRELLFCGTPCQVAAMKSYLRNTDTKKLLTVDLVCHGVPNKRMFSEFLAELEKEQGGSVTDCRFRDKTVGKWEHVGAVYYRKKEKIKKKKINYCNCGYYGLFLENMLSREACYCCPYAGIKRVGDISLCDFWGVEQFHYDDIKKGLLSGKCGVSGVLCNAKGRKWLEKCAHDFSIVESTIDAVSRYNHNLKEPTKSPQDRNKLLEEYRKFGYKAIADSFYQKYRKSRVVYSVKQVIPWRLKFWMKRYFFNR